MSEHSTVVSDWAGYSRTRRSSSRTAVTTVVGTVLDISADKKRLSVGSQGKWITVTKMISVIMLPVVALIFLSVSALASAISVMKTTNVAIDAINNFLNFDQAVTNLQVERGTSAQFLSSEGNNMGAFQDLIQFRVLTDQALRSIAPWPAPTFVANEYLPDAEAMMAYMEPQRLRINENNVSVDEAILFYTSIDTYIMDWADDSIVLPDSGNMWTTLVATSAMLRASDHVGIQRALGATFFTICGSSAENELWFTYLEGQVNAILSVVFDNNPAAYASYQLSYEGSQLQEQINQMRDNMASPSYQEECEKLDLDARYINSGAWFSQMTAYMLIMKNIRTAVIDELLQALDAVKMESSSQLSGYSVVMVMVSVACISLSVWYAGRIYDMISSITKFAKWIEEKSVETAKEKKKSEGLLHQLIPKAIAEKLKAQEEIKAEFFEVATIYFSDIVSFTTLSANSSPMEVVHLLNSLFSLFDNHIDRHKVYKVETIGDAYMVVSGVPEPTPRHAQEIALMSLELLQSLSLFQVPHMPTERLQIRIGLHTGSVVAGVVGSKMPRYCLFGTNVNIASTMESSGKAQQIHVSEAVKNALTQSAGPNQEFHFSEAEPIDYGMVGIIRTFFLDGYKDYSNGGLCYNVPKGSDDVTVT